ncbi:hypothetical protein QVD17_10865 [Tagetes erecta]|uniref:Small auxin up regulated protein n=1 Tax=Tagetes erecta TaxID=13708 RepID=A0AAD8L8S0_TARER|nr:hypothetical protein QVD17_10865 [Tagetes erecta]
MESMKTNTGKKNFLSKTWKRCRSFPINRRDNISSLTKSKSWNGDETKKKNKTKAATPEGYIPVCVGPEKQRFAMKTKYVNHPLFSMLLDDAETEYGYNCNGPINLACDVDLFYNVLAEMEAKDHVRPLGWSFAYGSCSPFNPSRRLEINGVDQMGKGYGAYEALTPRRLIKMS